MCGFKKKRKLERSIVNEGTLTSGRCLKGHDPDPVCSEFVTDFFLLLFAFSACEDLASFFSGCYYPTAATAVLFLFAGFNLLLVRVHDLLFLETRSLSFYL